MKHLIYGKPKIMKNDLIASRIPPGLGWGSGSPLAGGELYRGGCCMDERGVCVFAVCRSVGLSVCPCVGLSVCRCDGLLVCWFVGLSVCWLVGLSACRFVGLSVCRFVGLLVGWFVGLLVCWSVARLACRSVGLLVCWLAGLCVCWFVGLKRLSPFLGFVLSRLVLSCLVFALLWRPLGNHF